MGEYYRDAEHLYEIYGVFMEKVLTDPKIAPKLSKSNIIIKFIYTDPDTEIIIDLKNKPEKEGFFGNYYLVLERKPVNFFKFKAGKNFNQRNTFSILRIKICAQRRNWGN